MEEVKEKSTWYDEKADVLYITLEDEEGVVEDPSSNMLVRRSPEDGRVVGVTIMNFKKTLETSSEEVQVLETV